MTITKLQAELLARAAVWAHQHVGEATFDLKQVETLLKLAYVEGAIHGLAAAQKIFKS